MIREDSRGAASAQQPAGAVLRGRDIVCFSHDWTGDPLSKTHLMRLLARDNRILWVNSVGYRAPTLSGHDVRRAVHKLRSISFELGNPEPNIFVLTPFAMPLYGSAAARRLNRALLRFQVRRAMRKLGFRRAINWVFNPPAAVVAGQLDEDVLVYQCVDEYGAFSGASAEAMREFERILLEKAEVSIVSAERLLAARRERNPRTVLVRHGVDYEHFRRALDPATPVPAELARLPRPVLGFFGLIADWIDLPLLRRVAEHFSSGSLVLIGKAVTDVSILDGLPNVHWLGRKPYEELPGYCRGMDVALNPFRINELTLHANPLKVREYLAAGLPVVSSPIPEVVALGLCRIAEGPDATIREIEAALADPGPSPARSERVRGESWSARLEEIREHFARAMARRAAG